METVKLRCGVYGEGSVFSVEIKRNADVEALQKAIFNDHRYRERFSFPPSALTLYLARKDDGEWLKSDPGLKFFLKQGRQDHSVFVVEMISDWILGEDYLGANFEPGRKVIHVLVELPTDKMDVKRQRIEQSTSLAGLWEQSQSTSPKKQKLDVLEWEEEKKPVYSICGTESEMYFVNRTNAVEQLHHIHGKTFVRANRCIGEEWVIPLADNVLGLGKSSFGAHYIQKCRETTGALLTDDLDVKMNRLIANALRHKFRIPPKILSNIPTKTCDFVHELVEEVGPLFIVLDEIGKAFEDDNLNDIQCRDRFLSFCTKILDSWLLIKGLFFCCLVVDRSSITSRQIHLKCIYRPIYIFSRLNLHLLRPPAIESIMKNTIADDESGEPIQVEYHLDDQQMTQVASHLFKQTCGHPRSLLEPLKTCRTYRELMAYKKHTKLPTKQWRLLLRQLVNYRKEVKILLEAVENDSEFDLTKENEDAGKKSVTYDTIANNCFFAWEGEVTKAKLYVPPLIRLVLQQYTLPLDTYMIQIGKVQDITLEYATVFEWMCLKRFQELFHEKKQPMQVLPEFFSTPVFGNWDQVQFPIYVERIPKITERESSSTSSIDAMTATPDSWFSLLTSIETYAMNDGCASLKPRAQSASSDVILMLKSNGIKRTVGLAVKNYEKTEFSKSDFEKECLLFIRMFNECDDMDKRSNVLIVCATNFCAKYKNLFSNTGNRYAREAPPKRYKNIHEVILLDLSTKENRARFFFGNTNEVLSATLEDVIRKYEVEYEDTGVERKVISIGSKTFDSSYVESEDEVNI